MAQSHIFAYEVNNTVTDFISENLSKVPSHQTLSIDFCDYSDSP